ncbi:MAG: OmpP1/FadL family transporter [Panacagrimonas sp.]
MKVFRLAPVAALLALVPCLPAQATLGVFEHGNGIKSMGMGGVGYSFAEETTVLGANPAHALALGNRYDIGVDLFTAEAEAKIEGNTLGPDERFFSDGKHHYYIPQGGFSRALSDKLGLGVTVLSAGLGPDYDGSPYQRFGGARRALLSLASSGVVTALAYRVSPDHVLGFSLNTGYQVLQIKGLEFVATPATSVAPDKVTNQGKDGAFTAGFTVGWHGKLAPWLHAGVSYRSKNWTQKHEDYAGLVAEGGKLELPAIVGGGFAITPAANWTVVIEGQHYAYRDRRAFKHGLSKFNDGQLLGADNGPGFGFDNQNAYKLGVAWQATPKLMLRGGYLYATEVLDADDTLFGFLGCLTTTNQYGLGATYQFSTWELSGYAYNDPRKKQHGRNSIPASFGGGEASVSDEVYGVGFSVGRRFGS